MTQTQTHADTLVRYCMSIAQEFEARLNRIRVFVKHNLTSGTANEVILRDFLAMHTPKDFYVGQGFICDPSEDGRVSKQCDILVYNQSRYPVVYEDGPIKVVWPDSAKLVIEIKTQFQKNEIKSALENIKSAREVSITATGIIFAFHSAQLATVESHLKSQLSSVSVNHTPIAILLFDEGVIIHRTTPTEYIVRKSKKGEDRNAVVVTYLLLVFFDAVWKSSQGTHGAGVITILQEMLGKYTDKVSTIDFSTVGSGS